MNKDLNSLHSKVLEWAYERNIIGGATSHSQYIKAVTEMGELGDAILKKNLEDAQDAIGDILVCLINLAEISGTELWYCLDKAYEEIKDRKGIMYNDVFVKESDKEYPRLCKLLRGEND